MSLFSSLPPARLAAWALVIAAACGGRRLEVGSDDAGGILGAGDSGVPNGSADAPGDAASSSSDVGAESLADMNPGTDGSGGGSDAENAMSDSAEASDSGGGSGDAITCPNAPAAPVSPLSYADSSHVDVYGGTIHLQDGYAFLATSVDSGVLYTTYNASLWFMFTDYPNALGYASVGANKGGSRTLYGELLRTMSMGQPADFPPGTYPSDVSMQIGAYASDCGQGSQLGGLPTVGGQVIITAISATRIKGSVTGSEPVPATAPNFIINFDIPLLTYSDGGPPPWSLGIGGCCLQ